MDYNNTNSTRNSNSFSSFQTKILSLENKITIYKKELSVLEEKLLLYENDSKIKSEKLSEHVNQIMTLEKENNYLKNLLNQIKSRNNNNNQNLNENFNKTTSTQINNEFNIELNKLNKIIESLKTENENLNKINYEKNIQIDNLNKLLNQKNSENDAFNNDNTILLNKLKEYEENLNQTNIEKKNLNDNLEKNFENEIKNFNNILSNEFKTLSKYIETYFNFNFNENEIKVPELKNFISVQNDFIKNFDLLINSIQNAQKKIFNQYFQTENYIKNLKANLNQQNLILNQKIVENTELKQNITNLKEQMFEYEKNIEKLSENFENEKMINKKIQLNISDITDTQDNYFEKVYQLIKNELDKILEDKIFQKYSKIILNNNSLGNNNNLSNTSLNKNLSLKLLFEEQLDKLIMVNNCLIEDYKNIINDKDKIQKEELKEKIEILNNDLINLQQENEEYKRNLNNQKSEKILLMNQVEMLKNTNSSLSKQIVDNFNNNKEFYSYNYIEENDMKNNHNLTNNNYQLNENNNKFIEP